MEDNFVIVCEKRHKGNYSMVSRVVQSNSVYTILFQCSGPMGRGIRFLLFLFFSSNLCSAFHVHFHRNAIKQLVNWLKNNWVTFEV